MRQRRSAIGADRGREATRLRQVEPAHLGLAAGPAEGRGLDHRIGGIGAARRLAAARAVAVDEALEGEIHLVADPATEAASADHSRPAHASPPSTKTRKVMPMILGRRLALTRS